MNKRLDSIRDVIGSMTLAEMRETQEFVNRMMWKVTEMLIDGNKNIYPKPSKNCIDIENE